MPWLVFAPLLRIRLATGLWGWIVINGIWHLQRFWKSCEINVHGIHHSLQNQTLLGTDLYQAAGKPGHLYNLKMKSQQTYLAGTMCLELPSSPGSQCVQWDVANVNLLKINVFSVCFSSVNFCLVPFDCLLSWKHGLIDSTLNNSFYFSL